MKKHILAALITVMVILLTACGGSNNEPAPASSEAKAEQGSGEEEEKDTQERESETGDLQDGETEAGSSDEEEAMSENKNAETKGSNDSASSKDITFEKTVFIDNDECSITINEIDESDMFGFYCLKATFENKSSEKTYMFSVDTAYINGVKTDPLFATEVNPGKKANEDISFNRSVLEENGIVDFTDIEMTFVVYNSDDYEDNVAKETVHIYPYGEESAEKFTRDAVDTDTVLADDENVTIILTGYEKSDEWQEYRAHIYLVNKTDKKLMFSVEDASINGYMADPFFATELDAGKCVFTSLSWPYTTLEENGIEEVEEIAAHFIVYDSNDYENRYLDEEYTLNP